jgi:hypothetical protein
MSDLVVIREAKSLTQVLMSGAVEKSIDRIEAEYER